MSIKNCLGAIQQADKDYQLIDDHDLIAIGVSGGKDSMVLLYCLKLYQQWCIKRHIKTFNIIGIHLDMNFGGMDMQPIEAFAKTNDIPFVNIKTQIYDILKMHLNNAGNISCSLCSKLKKGAMIQEAKNVNATKTAFAHHGDDAVETLFLNMIHGGRIATFDPKMHLTNADMTFIRPLIYAKEAWINMAVQQANIPVVASTCPRDKHTQRESIKQLIQTIESDYPSAKYNLLKSLSNDQQIDLWHPIHESNESTSK